MMEDTVSGADSQVYVPDGEHPVTLDPVITLPGFKVGEPTMRIVANTYPTNFGDLAEPEASLDELLDLVAVSRKDRIFAVALLVA